MSPSSAVKIFPEVFEISVVPPVWMGKSRAECLFILERFIAEAILEEAWNLNPKFFSRLTRVSAHFGEHVCAKDCPVKGVAVKSFVTDYDLYFMMPTESGMSRCQLGDINGDLGPAERIKWLLEIVLMQMREETFRKAVFARARERLCLAVEEEIRSARERMRQELRDIDLLRRLRNVNAQ